MPLTEAGRSRVFICASESCRLSATLTALGLLHSPTSLAQAPSFPQRPLHFIVGFAAGGSTDIIARVIAQKLTETLQQPVVVDNRAGANGNIAAEATAKAAPDGYTMLMAANGLTINVSLYQNLLYDPLRDFSPITQVAEIPNVLVVHPSLPVRSVDELITLAKARPGQLTHGSSGTGSPGHMAGELFKMMTSVSFVHLPVKKFRTGADRSRRRQHSTRVSDDVCGDAADQFGKAQGAGDNQYETIAVITGDADAR